MDISTLSNDYNDLKAKNRFFLTKTAKEEIKDKWAHLVTAESCPVIHAAYMLACQKLKIKNPPPLILGKNDYIRGYALKDAILISTGTVDTLSDPEVLFILGHELGHHRRSRRQFLKECLGIGVGLTALSSAAVSTTVIDWSKVDPFEKPLITKSATIALTVYFNAQLMAHISQSEEYHCDAAGAEVAGTENAVSAIQKFPLDDLKEFRGLLADQPSATKRALATAILKVCKTLGPLIPQTHPSAAKRIAALRQNPDPQR